MNRLGFNRMSPLKRGRTKTSDKRRGRASPRAPWRTPFTFQYIEDEMKNDAVLPTTQMPTISIIMAGREGKVKRSE